MESMGVAGVSKLHAVSIHTVAPHPASYNHAMSIELKFLPMEVWENLCQEHSLIPVNFIPMKKRAIDKMAGPKCSLFGGSAVAANFVPSLQGSAKAVSLIKAVRPTSVDDLDENG